MHFAEKLCFGCALPLPGEYGYPAAHKTFTTRFKRNNQLGWKRCQAD